jgi:hypothetical protein
LVHGLRANFVGTSRTPEPVLQATTGTAQKNLSDVVLGYFEAGHWCMLCSRYEYGACNIVPVGSVTFFFLAHAYLSSLQIIASVIVGNIRGESELEDQCAWYGMSYLIDTTLGLLLAVIGLRILDWMANERDWAALKHSGVYAGKDGVWHWFWQCLAWLFILTIVKVFIYLFMWVCSEPLAWFGGVLFAPFQGYKHFELLFVMIFFPGFLNVIYFWIADSYLKAGKEHAAAHEGEEDKKEALVGQQKHSPDHQTSFRTDLVETEVKVYQPAPWSFFGRQDPQPAAEPSSGTVV